MPVGTYTINIHNGESEDYTESEAEAMFEVTRTTAPEFSYEVLTTVYPDDLVITVNASVAGNVTVLIDEEYTFEVESGETNISIAGLAAGSYSSNYISFTNPNYEEVLDDFAFEISKGTPTIDADISMDSASYPGAISVTVLGPDGNYNISVDGQVVAVVVVNGTSEETLIEGISAESQIVAVDFEGNDNYNNGSFTTTVTIVKNTADVSASAENVWIGYNATVVVTVPSDAAGSVTIMVNGKKYTAEIDAGVATATIAAADLNAGLNEIDVTYAGDSDYAPNFNSTTVNVLDGVVTNETFKYYFDSENSNYLVDAVPEGATLDFQGSFISNNYSLYIDSPVNIISSTGDALFDSQTSNKAWIKLSGCRCK